MGSQRITDPGLLLTVCYGNVVTEVPAEGYGFSWSPDSTRVAVWKTFGETIDVYALDGERQASLALPPGIVGGDSGPGAWMPDGSALLLDGSYVVPLDGSAPHDLSLGGQELEGAASYSPDGTRVAVAADSSITIMDADGSPVAEVDAPSSRGPRSPLMTWSPDGDRLAASSGDDHLFVIDVASATGRMLPDADTALPVGWKITAFLAFSPESDQTLYTATDAEFTTAALWSIGVDGSDARLVVRGPTQGGWLSR